MFIDPMKAKTLKPGPLPPGVWAGEIKRDGHRLIVEKGEKVTAWSRNAIERNLPPHLVEAISRDLARGVFDGELIIPGGTSSDVVDVGRQHELWYVVFDVLELEGVDTTGESYVRRHGLLDCLPASGGPLVANPAIRVSSREQVDALVKEIWQKGGEGLMLKEENSLYEPGHRSSQWLKVKAILTATMTIIGFREGRLGPHSIVELRDDEGVETSVKVLDDAELANVEANHEKLVGRKLVIEYQNKTSRGSYRHPRWDHWSEGE